MRQEVPAISSQLGFSHPPPAAAQSRPRGNAACLGQCLLLLQGPLPQGSVPTLDLPLVSSKCNPSTSFTHGFCVGPSGALSASTIHKSQVKINTLVSYRYCSSLLWLDEFFHQPPSPQAPAEEFPVPCVDLLEFHFLEIAFNWWDKWADTEQENCRWETQQSWGYLGTPRSRVENQLNSKKVDFEELNGKLRKHPAWLASGKQVWSRPTLMDLTSLPYSPVVLTVD